MSIIALKELVRRPVSHSMDSFTLNLTGNQPARQSERACALTALQRISQLAGHSKGNIDSTEYLNISIAVPNVVS